MNNVPKQRVCDLNDAMSTALNVSCTALVGIHGYSIPVNFVLLSGSRFAVLCGGFLKWGTPKSSILWDFPV